MKFAVLCQINGIEMKFFVWAESILQAKSIVDSLAELWFNCYELDLDEIEIIEASKLIK